MAASIELRERMSDEAPPSYRNTRSRSYRSVAAAEEGDRVTASCLEACLRFVLANKIHFLVLTHVVLVLSGLSTLAVVSTLASSRGLAPAILCHGVQGENQTCTIMADELVLPQTTVDPDDLDAVALHELTRRDLFRLVKRAVRDVFLKPGSETSVFQLLVADLTAHLESRDHPESG